MNPETKRLYGAIKEVIAARKGEVVLQSSDDFLQEKKMDQYRLARIAYRAYGKTTDFKNFQGNPMPEFNALPEKIKEAWRAACEAVAESVADLESCVREDL